MRVRGLVCGLTMWEVIDAAVNGRLPTIANVRGLLTEPDGFDPTGEPVEGLVAAARRLVQQGNPQISSLLGGFTVDNDETCRVRATADGQTHAMLSQPMRDDELKGGVPLNELGDRPVTVFAVVPHEFIKEGSIHSKALRLWVSAARRSLYRPSSTVCTFWLNEFAVLGCLGPIESALGLVAGLGIQLVIVVQSLTQLHLRRHDVEPSQSGGGRSTSRLSPPANSRRSSSSSLSPSAVPQLRPVAAARSRYCLTVDRATRALRDTAASFSPSACLSRSTSLIRRVATLGLGIPRTPKRARG